MKISRNWLQKEFFDAELPSANTLADALTLHVFEIDGIEKLGHGVSKFEDEVLDVKVTPNRGHDCLCHRGIAKEVSAIFKLPLKNDTFAARLNLDAKTDAIFVDIQRTVLCKRYIAGYIKRVKVGPSPEWLKQSLEKIGQRSINNIVDATNFVMFNLGQPLHAFDARKLQAKEGEYSIVVRSAKTGEKMLALDKKEYELDDSMLVIVDGNADVPIGIAGVKGGVPAAINKDTKDLIIESANFDSVSVRKTARKLNLRTDASQRFEQVISPELAADGMRATVELIQKIAGGEVAGFVDMYPKPQQQIYVAVTVEKVNRVLGTNLTETEVADAFSRLGFAYKKEEGVFEVHVPFERLDITIAEDLVEEIGRIVGYDKIPAASLSPFAKKAEVNANFYASEKIREELVAKGYSEVFTSVFAERGERVVANKIDGTRPYLRDSLLPGLAEALKKNIPNKDLLGLNEIKLFEIGAVWKGGSELTMIGTISETEKANEKPLEAEKAPAEYQQLQSSIAEYFHPFSKYPYIVRDIALFVPVQPTRLNVEEEVSEMIKKEAGELCVKISLFDRFERAGKTSLAFRLVFQSFDRTLVEQEVNKIMETVSAKLKEQGFEVR